MAGSSPPWIRWLTDVNWLARRRRDRLFVLGVALVVGVAAGAAAGFGDTERVGSYWTSAEFDRDGSAAIVEVIDYDFGIFASDRHGILRDIPGVERSSDITVSSPTAPDDLRVTWVGGEAHLRIGHPNITIRDRHRYRIEYPLDTLVEDDVVSWNGVGVGWDVGMDDVEIHLVAPFEFDDVICDQGRRTSVGGCRAEQVEPGHLAVHTGGLSAYEGVTVTATIGDALDTAPPVPPAPAGPADEPGLGLLAIGGIAAGATLVGAALTWPLIRRLGRERVWAGGAVAAAHGPAAAGVDGHLLLDHRQLAELATVEFEPPDDLGPARGGIIYDERVRPQHATAWLVERASRGEVSLDAGGASTRVLRGERPGDRDDARTLDAMFRGRDEVSLGSYDGKFAAAWRGLEARLGAWRDTSGLWDPNGRHRRESARVVGGVAAGIALIAVIVSALFAHGGLAGTIVMAGAAVVVGIGVTAVITSWELPVRTPEGSALWLQLESFRRFLAASEAKHAQAAAEMGLLLHYTAWAVALGEVDHWAGVVRDATNAGALAAMSEADLLLIGRSPSLGRDTGRTIVVPAPSGGGGGFGGGFGGGGAGGGGGGGGGGSW